MLCHDAAVTHLTACGAACGSLLKFCSTVALVLDNTSSATTAVSFFTTDVNSAVERVGEVQVRRGCEWIHGSTTRSIRCDTTRWKSVKRMTSRTHTPGARLRAVWLHESTRHVYARMRRPKMHSGRGTPRSRLYTSAISLPFSLSEESQPLAPLSSVPAAFPPERLFQKFIAR